MGCHFHIKISHVQPFSGIKVEDTSELASLIHPAYTSSISDMHCTMGSLIKCLVFLNVLLSALASDEAATNSTAKIVRLRRTGGHFPPLPINDYGVNGDDKDDSLDDSKLPSYKGKSQSGGDYPVFNEYKGNEQSNKYGLSNFPSFADNKGSPFPVPSWITPDQMMQMMAAIKNADDVNKPEGAGLFSKLITDPKIAAAAFIPLSIVAAAVVPVLMNYMMGNTASPAVSTTANNREFRSLDASKNLGGIMEHMARFARAIEDDECIQKTICRVVTGDTGVPKSDSAKRVASAIAHMLKEDWSDNLGIKQIVDGIKKGKCSNVCRDSVIASLDNRKNMNMLL
ncbi:uncharacterized protein NPIL_100391 [Nephila pilipes]|uniref:Uncharacterized protein n=1 Tax=Nephila pilipes TaxID=299642 RepID=A0A8X6MPA5_NEPPI|nr:uncharacterized protein NPIL_100391 [Nephila pilipes]